MPRRPVRVTSRPAAPAGFRPVGFRPAAAASSRPRRPAARAVRAVQAGFSLIELLVVVAVLSAVAFVALDAVEGDTNAIRESATRARLEQIRRAVVGRTDLALNGQPMVSGYVADVGRLPECLEALMVQQPDCDGDGTADAAIPAYAAVAGGILSHGWRGPYLVANGEGFEDAYGNGDGVGAPDYGWDVTYTPVTTLDASLAVVSLGRGRNDDATDGLADDIAMAGIGTNDFAVDLTGLVVSTTGESNASGSAVARCLALIAPDPDDPSNWTLEIIGITSIPDGATDQIVSAAVSGFTTSIGRRAAVYYDGDHAEVDAATCALTPGAGRTNSDVLADADIAWTPLLVTPRMTVSTLTITLD